MRLVRYVRHNTQFFRCFSIRLFTSICSNDVYFLASFLTYLHSFYISAVYLSVNLPSFFPNCFAYILPFFFLSYRFFFSFTPRVLYNKQNRYQIASTPGFLPQWTYTTSKKWVVATKPQRQMVSSVVCSKPVFALFTFHAEKFNNKKTILHKSQLLIYVQECSYSLAIYFPFRFFSPTHNFATSLSVTPFKLSRQLISFTHSLVRSLSYSSIHFT